MSGKNENFAQPVAIQKVIDDFEEAIGGSEYLSEEFQNALIDILKKGIVPKHEQWIREIIYSAAFSYHNLGKYFPIQTDSFDDLVDLNADESIPKDEQFKLSTLIPILAQWCVCLGLKDMYYYIQRSLSEAFPDCTYQIWYPDKDADNYLYTQNASRKSGNMEAPIDLTISFEEMENRIKLVQKRTTVLEDYSSHKAGIGFLPILASRHFRTPLLPIYWQALLIFKQENGD